MGSGLGKCGCGWSCLRRAYPECCGRVAGLTPGDALPWRSAPGPSRRREIWEAVERSAGEDGQFFSVTQERRKTGRPTLRGVRRGLPYSIAGRDTTRTRPSTSTSTPRQACAKRCRGRYRSPAADRRWPQKESWPWRRRPRDCTGCQLGCGGTATATSRWRTSAGRGGRGWTGSRPTSYRSSAPERRPPRVLTSFSRWWFPRSMLCPGRRPW